jgi:hypothetical protein
MPTYGDRVKETSTTTGTGTLTLAGAATGYQAFSNCFADQDIVYYCITDGTNWEVGQGTYTLSGTLLSRDTVIASSNAGALVNFTLALTVFNTFPATAAVGMHKASLPTQSTNQAQNVIRIAQDDNMMIWQDLVMNGTSEVAGWGTSDLAGIG